MNPTILLVDVASTGREIWKAFLEDQGYDVFTAESAESARRQCLQLQPDLVLLPDHLSGVSLFELCQRLEQDLRNQLTPVVLISPLPTQSEFRPGREPGAQGSLGTARPVWDDLGHIQSLLRLKSHVEEQAKSVILSLARNIEGKHSLMNGHSDRLANFAAQLGESLGLADEDLEELRLGCLLHDIGKVAVPDSILLKPGPLSLDETSVMRQHPVIGEQICAPLKSLRGILPMIRHHHERMDGSGYPDGLSGEEIPLKARILQVADVYDALISDRPYRAALSRLEALDTLHREAMYGWLDASLVLKFARTCRSDGHGLVRGRTMLASYYGPRGLGRGISGEIQSISASHTAS